MSLPPYIPKLPGLRCIGQVGVLFSDSGPGLKLPDSLVVLFQLSSGTLLKLGLPGVPRDLPSSSTNPFFWGSQAAAGMNLSEHPPPICGTGHVPTQASPGLLCALPWVHAPTAVYHEDS